MHIFPKSPQTIRLLCAADLHLGRPLPLIAKEHQGAQDFITNAWENFVEWAVSSASDVDAVLLAGDIFDNEDNLYEAVFNFEKGVVKLAQKGIHILAIAGNHDAELFAKRLFFSHLPRFRCLGKHGKWETCHLEFGSQQLRIDGWSFPAAHCHDNPLTTAPTCNREEIAIGMLHGECPGQKDSPYAPVNLGDFAATGHRAWVLGHVHIPQIILQQPYTFYCGSLQGLDSSEQGLRGATLLDIDSTGKIQQHFIPLAPLLWHHQKVQLEDSVNCEIVTQLQQSIQAVITRDLAFTRAVVTRLFLEGRVRNYQEVIEYAKSIEGTHHASLFLREKLIPCAVEKVVINCEPAFDLPLLAKGEDVVSQLARLLLQLYHREEEKNFLEKVHFFLEQKQMKYPHLTGFLTDDQLREECLRVGYYLLDALMKQRDTTR